MQDLGERLARIEEGQKHIREDIASLIAHISGITAIIQQNSKDIAVMQNDKKWGLAIAAATGSVIISVVGYLIK